MDEKQKEGVKLWQLMVSVGIKLTFHPSFEFPRIERWSAKVEFRSGGIGMVDCISGTIGTEYVDTDLGKVIDRVKEAAERIGICFLRNADVQPLIYVDENPKVRAAMPEDWREQVLRQSERLGWDCLYVEKPKVVTEAVKADLIARGYSVLPSKSKQGRFRWWRATGSDGVSVPKEEIGDEALGSEEEAWSAALIDHMARQMT